VFLEGEAAALLVLEGDSDLIPSFDPCIVLFSLSAETQ